MERFVVAGVLIAAALAVAFVLDRRRPDPPTQEPWKTPAQLDREDFAAPDAPWLVAVFTSATCDSCRDAVDKASVLASASVAFQEVPVQQDGALHERYSIEAVPTIVVADAEGVVRRAFVGPPTATDLWAAVAEARAPGSTPEPELGA